MAVPVKFVYPEEEWQTISPAEAGFLEPQTSTLLNSFTPRPNTDLEIHKPDEYAMVLTRAGYIVKRWGRTKDYLWQTASVGKAFTRAVLGLAAYRLGLNVDEPVWKTWTGIGQFSHDRKNLNNATHQAITWRHLINHNAGFGIENGFVWRWFTPPESWRAANWTGNPTYDMISFRQPDNTINTYFYSSANYVRLGQALTALWGLDLKTLLDQELFSKMGIPADRWRWMSLREVYENVRMYPGNPGYGHYADEPHEINGIVVRGAPGWVLMSAEDLARFGLLLASEGMWKGERLLSAEWLVSKSGGNGSSVFGDPATLVAGSRITTTTGLPPTENGYFWAPDTFNTPNYSFSATYIDSNVTPGLGRVTQSIEKAYAFGLNDSGGAVSLTYPDGAAWRDTTIDSDASLSRLSVMFDQVGGPRIYGIRRDVQNLYEAYWDGNSWNTAILDPNVKLTAISVVRDPVDDWAQIFGIRAADGALYQAWRSTVWEFRTLPPSVPLTNLAAIDAVFAEGTPQVFGIDATSGNLMHAYYDGAWQKQTLDGGVSLKSVAAVVDTATGAPHVFGIRSDGALYEKTKTGATWNAGSIVDATVNLTRISAISHGSPAIKRVFGIRATTKALYQAVYNGSWTTGDIHAGADLVELSAVYDQAAGVPRVYGIESDKALYHAVLNGATWNTATIDANANLSQLDAAYGTRRIYGLP